MPKGRKVDSLNNYRIFETEEFLSNLDRLDSEQKRFVGSKLNKYTYPQIKEQPHYGINIKKLQGYKPETWRYRLGQFRLFYGIDESKHIVSIVAIDYRKDAYT